MKREIGILKYMQMEATMETESLGKVIRSSSHKHHQHNIKNGRENFKLRTFNSNSSTVVQSFIIKARV